MKVATTSLTALSAVLLLAGCCSTKKTAATTTTSYTATETPSEKTYVREQETANDVTIPLYSESLAVGKREVEGGGSVRLRKTVKTETVSQPIDLRRETITIDRESFETAQRAAQSGQPSEAFKDKEIVLELKHEEPVVELQSVMSGRIVVQKRATTERQNIERQVRREDVEVIKQGDSKDIIVSERVTQGNSAVGAPARSTDTQTGNNPKQQQ